MYVVNSSIAERCLVAAAAAVLLAATLALAACSNDVSSRALVRPTRDTGERAMQLLRGEETHPTLNFVYGYFAAGPTTCSDVHDAPVDGTDRYGVLVCEDNRPLSAASFVHSWRGTGRVPDGDTDHRLALIATGSLVPSTKVSEP
jgi:hypothetical protein